MLTSSTPQSRITNEFHFTQLPLPISTLSSFSQPLISKQPLFSVKHSSPISTFSRLSNRFSFNSFSFRKLPAPILSCSSILHPLTFSTVSLSVKQFSPISTLSSIFMLLNCNPFTYFRQLSPTSNSLNREYTFSLQFTISESLHSPSFIWITSLVLSVSNSMSSLLITSMFSSSSDCDDSSSSDCDDSSSSVFDSPSSMTLIFSPSFIPIVVIAKMFVLVVSLSLHVW